MIAYNVCPHSVIKWFLCWYLEELWGSGSLPAPAPTFQLGLEAYRCKDYHQKLTVLSDGGLIWVLCKPALEFEGSRLEPLLCHFSVRPYASHWRLQTCSLFCKMKIVVLPIRVKEWMKHTGNVCKVFIQVPSMWWTLREMVAMSVSPWQRPFLRINGPVGGLQASGNMFLFLPLYQVFGKQDIFITILSILAWPSESAAIFLHFDLEEFAHVGAEMRPLWWYWLIPSPGGMGDVW